jgi:pimeloyl-ACP methyl ester carboxylesterase
MPNLVADALSLVGALGYKSVAAVIGHDFGSPVAAWCALLRPDVFRSAVLMSAPFAGPPSRAATGAGRDALDEDLARLTPPRKHYQRYYCTREANDNLWRSPQGVHPFLRAYFHMKSADWKANRPFRLASITAVELAKMPTYYIMERDKGMAETVAPEMPGAAEIARCRWLPEEELAVYSGEFARTGFQGGLNWYRCRSGRFAEELATHSGRTIAVPCCFIAGKSDWGVYQVPGALEAMEGGACADYRGTHLIDGAGHWVQQEQPESVARLLLQFLRDH